MNQEHRFLIVLDGLDEMSQRMSDTAVLRNLTRLEDLMEQFRGQKLLVTSRKMAIYSDRVRERILLSLGDPEVLHLAPVSRGDRLAFLERMADTPERKARLLKIQNTHDLLGLAAKPLFLDMMRIQLDSDDIRALDGAGIYQDYAKRVLENKYNLQLALRGDYTHPGDVRERLLGLLEELALCLQRAGTDSISLEDPAVIRMGYLDRFTVKLPYGADYAEKMRILRLAIESDKVQDNMTGTFDMTREDGRVYLDQSVR